MGTESPIRILEADESKKWPSTVDSAMFTSALSNIEQTSRVPNRSGSAPPTVEGSIASLRTFVDQWNLPLIASESGVVNFESEEQMRTHPTYISYYYAHVNLNPRLPPPLISQENRDMVRIMRATGGNKLASVTEVPLPTHKEEPEEEEQSPQQTLVDAVKGNFSQAPSNTAVKGEDHDHNIRTASTTDQSCKMQESCSGSVNVLDDVHAINSHTTSYSKSSESVDNMSTQSDIGSDVAVLQSRMESLNVSGGVLAEGSQMTQSNINPQYQNRYLSHPSQDRANQVPVFQGNIIHQGLHGGMEKLPTIHPKPAGIQTFMHTPPQLFMTTGAYMNPGNVYYPILHPPAFPNPNPHFAPTTSASVFQPPYFGGNFQSAVPMDPYSTTMGMFKQPMEGPMGPYPAGQMLYLSKSSPLQELMMRPSFGSPLLGQYQQTPFDDARMAAIQHGQFNVTPMQRSSSDIATVMRGDKELHHHPSVNYYGHPPRLVLPHFATPSTSVVSGPPMAVKSNHPSPGSDVNASQCSPKNAVSSSDWKGQRGSDNGSDDSKRNSFLELVKSCNSKKLELSDISGKIVEFSTDQHGSRFIQQKLEHCGYDEKESVFKEVLPHASKLMTDVFGNYVIQKFFEHGNAEQRRKLAEQLVGQILPFSLQMYGCRVIQKALEVIELDQKTRLIQELDGHVMRCVHDQNGNHVIQKCIETVPTQKVAFITSAFRGEVATLSSHPYGCRVIQRVLEHCSDEQTCRWIVDEIMESASDLAQDPYGNYVTQHVLEMGKPHERSQVIRRLNGKFVQMCQHKYASNVVEKCLKYGDASERDLIIEEIVVQPDNDDGLLKMMKDQFGNYVVQKIFDMGNDKQKGILLKCVQTHLSALKKFPYAKHIVARYEQLSEGPVEEQKQ